MSLRWRADGRLLCAAKHGVEEGDTYLDDRLHYELAVLRRVLIPEPDEPESGAWRWADEHTRSIGS